MKYWRGYLVAGILLAISGALTAFAKAHTALVDMIYPYMTRIVITSLADWSGGVSICLWQVLLIFLIVLALVTIILTIILRWNPIQVIGWVLACVCGISMLNTVLYGLNDYTGPFAEDVRLEVTDLTVSELNEATAYFRDQANALANQVERNSDGSVNFADFDELTKQAKEGFKTLTYDQAISIFAGSTAPVKKLNWSWIYTASGVASMTVPLTGEACVNPDVPDIAMPFVMCQEMSRRMIIAGQEDSRFAAYLACTANSSPEFQYSAYCIAYYYCHSALEAIPTSTAQSCAKQTASGLNKLVQNDLADYEDFFGEYTVDKKEKDKSTAAELLASWYVQEFITPLHVEVEKPFDPYDPNQVDLSGIANAPEGSK